jgi:hypothetical protein
MGKHNQQSFKPLSSSVSATPPGMDGDIKTSIVAERISVAGLTE